MLTFVLRSSRARRIACVALVGFVTACAHSAPDPVVRDPLTPEANLSSFTHLLITSQTMPGVGIPDAERQNVVAMVRREITERAPGRFALVDESAARSPAIPADAAVNVPKTLHMHIVFTRYDEGNAFARFMLAGLGQIHVATDVTLKDQGADTVLGRYDVSKQFAFGGIYGGSTTVQDVEKGLAAGIAEIVVPGTAVPKKKEWPAYP